MPHVFDTNDLGVVTLHEPRDLAGAIPYQPLFPAPYEIAKKHAALGGVNGFLGHPLAGLRSVPGGSGFFIDYVGGSIFWSEATGAHEIHGDIRDKWRSLGGALGFLGFPSTDETAARNSGGRFNDFQGGAIYWSPGTGAHEVHGDILVHWLARGGELSGLGYPTTDENYFSEGGRVSTFQVGSIYWWPDTGALAIKSVSVGYHAIRCYGETDSDQGSNSDEPYVVLGVATPISATSTRTVVYEDVDSGEYRRGMDADGPVFGVPDIVLYKGNPRGITITSLLMESDGDDADMYLAPMKAAADAAFQAIHPLVANDPGVGPYVLFSATLMLAVARPAIGTALSGMATDSDDRLDDATIAISAKDMILLGLGALQSDGQIVYDIATPLLSGDGASYRAYFGIGVEVAP